MWNFRSQYKHRTTKNMDDVSYVVKVSSVTIFLPKVVTQAPWQDVTKFYSKGTTSSVWRHMIRLRVHKNDSRTRGSLLLQSIKQGSDGLPYLYAFPFPEKILSCNAIPFQVRNRYLLKRRKRMSETCR